MTRTDYLAAVRAYAEANLPRGATIGEWKSQSGTIDFEFKGRNYYLFVQLDLLPGGDPSTKFTTTMGWTPLGDARVFQSTFGDAISFAARLETAAAELRPREFADENPSTEETDR